MTPSLLFYVCLSLILCVYACTGVPFSHHCDCRQGWVSLCTSPSPSPPPLDLTLLLSVHFLVNYLVQARSRVITGAVELDVEGDGALTLPAVRDRFPYAGVYHFRAKVPSASTPNLPPMGKYA